MNLTAIETDALAELFNVGLHRAAASLSELTGQRILVELPKLWICPISDVQPHLFNLVEGELATVHQIFKGAVGGDAVLLLEHDKAALLARLMTRGEVGIGGRLDASAREVLAEVGNIVLGACLSAFGDMLSVEVAFSVPRMHIESLEGLLRSLQVDTSELQYAVIVATQFRLSELAIGGYMIIALGVTSLSLITHTLNERSL